jgi:hypothetical protein
MPSAPDELTEFVKAALSRGVPRAGIEDVLRQAGWTIDQAGWHGRFVYDVPSGAETAPGLDARDASYSVLFSAYWSAYHLGSLCRHHQCDISRSGQRPEAVDALHAQRDAFSVASLIVAFPCSACRASSRARRRIRQEYSRCAAG